MKVRYLCSMGVPEGPGIQAGDEVDIPKDEAERLIASNLAEPCAARAKTATSRKAARAKTATKD